jgi:hypothetical protein
LLVDFSIKITKAYSKSYRRINLSGGLGSQLFQWQAALIAGLLSNENVQIDLRGVLGNHRDL